MKPKSKIKTTRLPDSLAAELERLAASTRISEGRLLELATERLLAEVKETGKLPLPDLTQELAGAGATAEGS